MIREAVGGCDEVVQLIGVSLRWTPVDGELIPELFLANLRKDEWVNGKLSLWVNVHAADENRTVG